MKNFKINILSLLIVVVFFSCSQNDTETLEQNQSTETAKSITANTVIEGVKTHVKSDGSFNNPTNPESSIKFDFGFDFVYPTTLAYNNGTKVVVNNINDLAKVASTITTSNYIDGIAFPFAVKRNDGKEETISSEADFEDTINSHDTDNDGIPNYTDTDDDNDGAVDTKEDANHDGDSTNDDADNDGVANYQDTDSDNDGQLDQDEDNDGDGDFTNEDSDGDGEADYTDTDSDNDGTDDGEDSDDDNDGTNDSDEDYNGGNGIDGSNIDPASLPQTILDYITQNYANATIIEAEIESNGNYEVSLSNGVELYFNSNGDFLMTGNDDNGGNDDNDSSNIDPASLPQIILDYITQNYPNTTITEAEIESNGNYEVSLSNDVELYFDQDGNFLSTGD